MKISEHWLREWVNPAVTSDELCERLTMAGLEIEEVAPVAEKFSGVVVGKVLHVEKHPEADRLHVCTVDTNGAEPLTIVCGAKNVQAGIKVAAALEGAVLANNLKITASKLRGVLSHGMLCSAQELGLTTEGEGLIVLPADAPVGENVWEYLNLADHVIDISITPNRGDCLSVLGVATDIAALMQTEIHNLPISKIETTISDTLPVTISEQIECPHYVGRIIRNVTADAITPVWLQERLRRSGTRSISPIVDVMNYVMLELGQPMHAFDLEKISGGIEVRMAKTSEQLELLDGQTITFAPKTLVIADQQKPLAIAGVMGGLDSGVTLLTKNIFLESAFFQPTSIARTSRHYKLGSDSSYRFERGVDPALQMRAIERATQLILVIAGGEAGPVTDELYNAHLPQPKEISLRSLRIAKILGLKIADHEIENILQRLSFVTKKTQDGWQVTVPARRFDITLEIDLIEEIIRIYGYEKIPLHTAVSGMQINPRSEKTIPLATIRHLLSGMGYQEVVTYSFVDKKLQNLFDPETQPKELLNPMTSEMSVMRTTLWPGLVNTLLYNRNRQQSRVRIFETGLRFIFKDSQILQQPVVSGLICGSAMPEQWNVATRKVDFFDLKGDLENILKLTFATDEFEFKNSTHSSLHPGQAADIYRSGEYVGVLGALHPAILQSLDLQEPVLVFEMLLDRITTANLPRFSEISKFPEIRRDIALLVNQAVPVRSIQDTIINVAGELLQDVKVFDVYQGKGVAPEQKSIALALILQHATRTLVDEEVALLMERVINALKEKFAAELRG
ncbi:MAG: phenylalanine--tRNA ligase subunit beta [Gammaproteobacteria bacterium]